MAALLPTRQPIIPDRSLFDLSGTTQARLNVAQRGRSADRLEAGEVPIRKLAHYISAESTMVAKQQRNLSGRRLLYINVYITISNLFRYYHNIPFRSSQARNLSLIHYLDQSHHRQHGRPI
jgi:hypothetical protein